MIEQRRAVGAGWPEDDLGGKGELFHLLVDSLWDHAIFATDPEGVVRTWTPGAERLFGHAESEIVGRSADAFFDPNDLADGLPAQLLRDVVENGRSEAGRWLVRKDSSRFWAVHSMTPLRGELGDLRGFAWTIKDRTEWWLADRERRAAEGRNAAILNSALDCIVLMDQQGHVIGFNPAAERTFGIDEASAIGRDLADVVIPPPFREQHRRGLAHYLATGEGPVLGRRIEVLAMRADGTEFPAELAITPITTADSTTFTAYLRDLTDRRNRDREVAERRRLAEFGRDVGLALTARTSLEEMLDRVARESVVHLDGAFARIWTLDEAGETLELKASAGMYTHLEGNHARIPIGKFKIGRIAEQRRPHLTNAVVGDPMVPAQDWAKREGMVAFAGYPLIVEDRLVGVWALFARHPLSLATLEAMESVAAGIAGAIERKRVEEGLAEQKEWLQVTIDSIGDAVISTDGEGRVVFMNPVAEALTGWSRADAAGRPLEAVFHIVNEYTRQPAETPVKQVLRDGIVVGLANHTVVIARDGRETAIEDSAAPIKDASGKVVGVVMVFQDATDRRKHERALRESEERFRQLADSMPQLAWMADETGSIGWYNRRWYDYTGTKAEEMVGWGWQSVHDPAYLESVLDRFRGSIASGQPFDMVFPLRGADGAFRPFLTRAMPLRDEAGRVVQWFGTNTDISEQRELEEALRAAGEEAAEANRSKDRFLAVLSHELRTPLNPILLAASSMLERPPEPNEIRPALEMIRQNVMLQARLIDDLLDVMRIVRGKMPLHWEVVDAHRLIRLSTQICQSEVFGKEIRLKLFLEAADHHINADPARFQQVIWNLVKNAVKFTPGGGTITVKSRNEGADHLVVEVSDTGIGIEAEVLPLIFDPFQQGETKITRKYGGLGLGLAICRGIVDAHGGTLVALSAGKDRGSTFRIELKTIPTPLPATVEDRPSDAESARPLAAVAGLKLLLVEDEPATIRLMARLMRGLGHEVTTASTVAAAFEAVEAAPFDLIVSDIGLPDGTGLDLMRRTVALRGPVKAIALTGYGMEEDIRRSREAGFTAHLTKPIDFAKLEALIRRVVG